MLGLYTALTGECMPGQATAVAEGNAMGKGPVVFELYESGIKLIRKQAAGEFQGAIDKCIYLPLSRDDVPKVYMAIHDLLDCPVNEIFTTSQKGSMQAFRRLRQEICSFLHFPAASLVLLAWRLSSQN